MSEKITVNLGSRSYDIHVAEQLLEKAATYVSIAGRKTFVLHDENVKQHVDRLLKSIPDAKVLSIAGGEKAKSYSQLEKILDWLLANGVDRKSVLFVVGGGVIGDLGGFAASIVLRGIDFVQIPTTLLAQVDSSVGGKTGINTSQGKNLVGAFYQPLAVLCDTGTLKTLPDRELKAGYAEIVKYGLLGSRDFYEWLEGNGKSLLALDASSLLEAIKTSCRMKADIVGDDEYERAGGKRALLNLGHTFAHALEAAAGYDGRLLHGEAVSIGLVLASRLCVKMDLLKGQDAVRIENHLKTLDLKTEIASIMPALSQSADDIVGLMAGDKKAAGGKIGFILMNEVGRSFQSYDVDMDLVRAVVAESL